MNAEAHESAVRLQKTMAPQRGGSYPAPVEGSGSGRHGGFCRSGMEVSGIVRVGKHSSAAIEVGSALKLGHRVCKPVVVWAYTKSNLSSIRIVETICSLL